jgi:hypothetical protein
MEVFGTSTPPANIQIVYWYFKKFSFIILLMVAIIILLNFGEPMYLKLICFILSIFIPFTFSRNIKRIIYNITFDDDNKMLILNYFILWKKRRLIPYHELHVESIIKNRANRKQEELIISLWRKEYVSGEISFPAKNAFWDKKQIIDISKKFFTLKIIVVR